MGVWGCDGWDYGEGMLSWGESSGSGGGGMIGSPIHLRNGPFVENSSSTSVFVPSRASLMVLYHPIRSVIGSFVRLLWVLRKYPAKSGGN